MTNKDKDQIIWKTYPEYQFLKVNQFGEIRTKNRIVTGRDGKKYHVKGRILKQQRNKDGYMCVEFSVNNKTVRLLVHRIVATCFIPNLHGYLEVNHIDNDRTNNVASNLEWCTREYNIAYKEKYGKSAAEVSGRPVFAVNLETGEVLMFETQKEAGRKLGIDAESINRVIKGKLNQSGGYWFTEDENEITEEKIREIEAKAHFFCPVIAINPETFEVSWFKSKSEASCQLGVDISNITKVVRGKMHKTGGYWFCNADEDAVEKARAEFGNKIAEKVEKLFRKKF